jgi:hypothetical protein
MSMCVLLVVVAKQLPLDILVSSDRTRPRALRSSQPLRPQLAADARRLP